MVVLVKGADGATVILSTFPTPVWWCVVRPMCMDGTVCVLCLTYFFFFLAVFFFHLNLNVKF